MEKEINTIKKEYQAITPPEILLTNGVEDLWHRINMEKHSSRIYLRQFAITGAFIILIFSGVIGFSYAYPKPGTIFYQVKKITQKAVNSLSKLPLMQHMHTTQIHQNTTSNKSATITPIESSTPTITSSPSENKNQETLHTDGSVNKNKNNSAVNQNPTLEDVKGASTENSNSNSDKSNNSSNNQNNGNSDKNSNNAHSEGNGNSNSVNGESQSNNNGNDFQNKDNSNHGKN